MVYQERFQEIYVTRYYLMLQIIRFSMETIRIIRKFPSLEAVRIEIVVDSEVECFNSNTIV